MKKISATVVSTILIIVASNTAMADDGAATYKQACSSCHEAGISGAPKLNDEIEWMHRVTKGADGLYASIVNNKCKLLKELRHDLSDDQIKAAVNYMVSHIR